MGVLIKLIDAVLFFFFLVLILAAPAFDAQVCFYSDSGFYPLLYSDPDLVPWMLAVVYILFTSFHTLYLSYRMCWAGLLQVGSDWEQMVAAQNFGSSLKREFCRSSELCVLDPSLEQELSFVSGGSSEKYCARACVCVSF
ncbi:hypothetical protein CsSME_00019330 [Camellia sinensis var. sinensis]